MTDSPDKPPEKKASLKNIVAAKRKSSPQNPNDIESVVKTKESFFDIDDIIGDIGNKKREKIGDDLCEKIGPDARKTFNDEMDRQDFGKTLSEIRIYITLAKYGLNKSVEAALKTVPKNEKYSNENSEKD